MKRKIGTVFIVIGAALLLGALSLLLSNGREAAQAEAASAELMPRLAEEIQTRKDSQTQLPTPEIPEELLTAEDLVMPEIEIDGYSYIGYLSIPALELELPVMADWDYTRLRIAPCRYSGTLKGGDLVLMAHNYQRHFGRISELTEGDSVIFVDAEGTVYPYEVAVLDILAPTAVEEMTAGDFDLTLFTCTYGGQNRVTVCCNRIK